MKFITMLFLFLISSCIVSEQEMLTGSYSGDDGLYVLVKNGIVKNFNLSTNIGDISLSGNWDIIESSFYIETFSDNKTIIVIGEFDTDSTIYGDWYVDKTDGTWSGKLVKSSTIE